MARANQFHFDGENQGFIPIRTKDAVESKWSLEIGPVGYGSPVIGIDGIVYIGTLTGELAAINPNGTLRWKVRLSSTDARYPGKITGSPAVGSDNHIYVITTANVDIRDHREGKEGKKRIRRSSLHRVDPAGNITWTYPFPEVASPAGIGGYTASSPKVWGNPPRIFVPSIYWTSYGGSGHAVEILVIDQMGQVIHRKDVASYPPEPVTGQGPGISDILNGIWDFISSPVDFDTSGVDTGIPSLEKQFGLPEPTIAIVDTGQHMQNPLIIIEDAFKTLAAFRFESPILVSLWSKVSKKSRFRSSPAVFPSGIIALGDINGTISLFSVENGNEISKPWYKADKPVVSPPASFGRQIYFVADNKVIVLDSDSELWKQHFPIGKSLAAPALSANHLYISAFDGFYTFSFDLGSFTKNSNVIGGISSPVISDDGTVYVMDLNKKLWAFGGTPPLKPTGGTYRVH